MFISIPWWVIVVIAFICFSGFMSYRAARAEKKLEHYFIEREGEVYMERIRQEQSQRAHTSDN